MINWGVINLICLDWLTGWLADWRFIFSVRDKENWQSLHWGSNSKLSHTRENWLTEAETLAETEAEVLAKTGQDDDDASNSKTCSTRLWPPLLGQKLFLL